MLLRYTLMSLLSSEKNTMNTLTEHGSNVRLMNTIRFVVRPRLHLGLISMHEGGIRKNGGIGFSVKDPCGTMEMTKSRELIIEDHRMFPLDALEIEDLYNLIDSVSRKHSLDSRVHVRFAGDLKTHVGMGSGTAMRLSVLEGLFRINKRSISVRELIRQSKRGGTSGIGINTYFSGGLVLDLGVWNNDNKFVPSSLGSAFSTPLSFPSVVIPNWPLCLCVPRSIPTKSRKEEIEFFSRATPIDAMDSYVAAYHAIFGVYSAVVEKNYRAFCTSIYALQETKWKMRERNEYSSELEEVEARLLELGATSVGMSSLGPMLYCFGGSGSLDRISAAAECLDCYVTTTIPYNSGREMLLG